MGLWFILVTMFERMVYQLVVTILLILSIILCLKLLIWNLRSLL